MVELNTCRVRGCGKTFKKHYDLQRHYLYAHGRVFNRWFACISCEKIYKSKHTLKAHVAKQHHKS